jgi:hypothetical protein
MATAEDKALEAPHKLTLDGAEAAEHDGRGGGRELRRGAGRPRHDEGAARHPRPGASSAAALARRGPGHGRRRRGRARVRAGGARGRLFRPALRLMELPVSLQAAQFALAAALGAGLAALYGFLRACSRLHPRLTGLTDAAFSLAAFYSLVCFTLGPARGLFRLFLLPALALGAALWFLTASGPAGRLFSGFWRAAGGLVRLVLLPGSLFLKFFRKILKKFFASREKWVTIFDKIRRASGPHKREGSGKRNEVRQVVTAGQAGCADPGGVRSRHARLSALSDQREKCPGRHAHDQHRGRRAGKRPPAGGH